MFYRYLSNWRNKVTNWFSNVSLFFFLTRVRSLFLHLISTYSMGFDVKYSNPTEMYANGKERPGKCSYSRDETFIFYAVIRRFPARYEQNLHWNLRWNPEFDLVPQFCEFIDRESRKLKRRTRSSYKQMMETDSGLIKFAVAEMEKEIVREQYEGKFKLRRGNFCF